MSMHRMRHQTDPTVTGVSVGGRTYYADEAGVFTVPADVAVVLAGQRFDTVGMDDAAEPAPRKRAPRAKAEATA